MDIRDFFEFEDAVNEYFYFLLQEEEKENSLNELLDMFSVFSQVEPKFENTYKYLSSNILGLKKDKNIYLELSKEFLKLSNLAKSYFKNSNKANSILLNLQKEKELLLSNLKENRFNLPKIFNLFLITYLQDNLDVIKILLKRLKSRRY